MKSGKRLAALAAVTVALAVGITTVPTAALAASTPITVQSVATTYDKALALCNSNQQLYRKYGYKVGACTLVGYTPGLVYFKFIATA